MLGWRVYFLLCQWSPRVAQKMDPLLLRIRRWAYGF